MCLSPFLYLTQAILSDRYHGITYGYVYLYEYVSVSMCLTGTMAYMSPERIEGGMYGVSADVWSLGLALLTLALGRLPIPTHDG
jgi:serine/threonine protein kinase